jgi:hypothetical protein
MFNNLNTLDLYNIDKCSKWWIEELSKIKDDKVSDPTQELIKKIFLMKSVGRDTGWNFKGIASLWDKIFWRDKDVNKDSIKQSVKGILSARHLYKKISVKNDIEIYSTNNLTTYLDCASKIKSSGDFLLSYPNRYETWIYSDMKKIDVKKSPLVMLEHYLIQQSIRDFHQKEFYLVIYHTSINRKTGLFFKTKGELNINQNRIIFSNLVSRANKKINFPSIGNHCDKCNLEC